MGLLTDYLYGPDSSAGGSGASGGLLTRYLSNRKSKSSDSPGSDAEYKKGGIVKKTEKALVHKGERVLTKAQAKKYAAKKKGGK